MKYIRYKKYEGEDWDSLDMQELLDRLADFLLQSGFNSDYYQFSDGERTMESLRQAVLDALEDGSLFSDERLQEMQEKLENMTPEQREQLADQLIERMEQEGYVSITDAPEQSEMQQQRERGASRPGGPETHAKFELTDKSLDFLGFKTLKDLLGSLGKASFGRHDTRDLATGVEASGASKKYEFGDTLNLDISATLFRAVKREGLKVPIEIDYADLQVHQSEYQSSCATVLMLDCSHSMILYGEDRFTPAKRVALALSHLIRTQYPGRLTAPDPVPRFGRRKCR